MSRTAAPKANPEALLREGTPVNALTVRQLRAGYGAIQVLHGVDLDVEPGEIVALLGANGAGKTTLLRALSGLLGASGNVQFRGRRIESIGAAERVRMGLTQIPQGRGTFVDFTVQENLELGAFCVADARTTKRAIDKWFSVFPRLADRRRQIAGSLSGGEQQMLAVARALMSSPKLLMCDEPSLGLAPAITHELFSTLSRLNHEEGLSILLVEQNAHLTLPIARRAYVMEQGAIVIRGEASMLMHDPAVRRAYLGASA